MKYRNEVQIHPEHFHYTDITDEIIYKDLAIGIIKEMSLSELSKIFKFNKENIRTERHITYKSEINTPE